MNACPSYRAFSVWRNWRPGGPRPAKVAFHLRPVSFEQLTAVADAGGTMPPKSTYIEPKLRSGITIYSLLDR